MHLTIEQMLPKTKHKNKNKNKPHKNLKNTVIKPLKSAFEIPSKQNYPNLGQAMPQIKHRVDNVRQHIPAHN
jgi:hypothetical protein